MLILKQNAANTVPTPPAGKGTIFLDDSDTLSVKTSDGNVETFPTVGASNAQVVFMNGTSLSGESDFTYDFNTNVLTVSGNIAAGNVLTDNLLYANGTPWDLQEAAGSNNQIQYNLSNNFAASANFTYNDSTQVFTVAGNAQFNNANLGNLATANVVLAGTNAASADFPNSVSIFSKDNTGVQATDKFGLVGEATGDSANTSTTGVGVFGIGKANGDTRGTGVQGFATVTNSGDTGAAVGVRGYATTTHSGGYNIGVLGNAAGSGYGNYAFYVQAGNIASIETDTAWDLNDNSAAALAFNSSGKANILAISTVDNAEGVSMSGTLTVTGNITATAGLKTDNLYYANGNPWDLQEAAGSNNQIQYNSGNNFAASANLAYDDSTQVLTVLGNGAFNNVNAGNLLTANFVSGTLTTASQPNITSVGNLTSLDVTGNVLANNLNATAFVTAGNVYANSGTVGASLLAGTLTTASQPNVTSVGTLSSLAVSGNATAGNIFANSGTIGASLLAGTLTTASQPNVTSLGTLTGLDVNGNITAANITANTGVFTGNGSGLSAIAGANVTGTVANATHASTANTVVDAAQPNITSVGTLTSLAVTGNASAGNISTGGVLSVTGNANVGNIGGTGAVFTTLGGTLTTNAQPNITSVGTLANLSVTGNANVGNIGAVNAVFTGTGSFGGNVAMANFNITNLAEPVNSTDAATKAYVDGVAEGLHTHDSCNAATDGTLATISSGTVTYDNGTSGVGATLTTTGSYTTIDGVTLSDGMRILVKNEANAAHNGIYVRSSSTVLTRATDFDTPAEMAGGDFTFVTGGTLYDNTGWVMPDPVTTVGTTNVNWTQFSGAGAFTAGTGLTLTGTQFSVNASQTQVTQVGTLTGLDVNGNITAANITANTGVFTGNGSGLSSLAGGNVTGQVGNALVAGTVYTAAQANITSVGTLTGLDVNGNITAANITANTGVFTGNGIGLSALAGANVTGQVGNALVAGTVYTAAQPNITSVGTLTSLTVTGNASAGNISTGGALSVTGNANVGNIGATAGVFTNVSGNGAGLTGLNASNLASGTVSADRLSGTYTITVSGSATTAGTVTTAAQPNITSVGTLTSLSVTGNVSAGNIVCTGVIGGAGADLTGNLLTTGANTTAGTVTGNWTLSAGSRWNATYADLAEKYVADASYEPGTVLVFGGEHEVTAANEFDSTRVAGVVSTDPAYIMNAGCEGEHVAILALQGRVPCKVKGPVSKGDLMVSGSDGHAVANNMARAGTIIGKALENFDGESGVIEVVVGRF